MEFLHCRGILVKSLHALPPFHPPAFPRFYLPTDLLQPLDALRDTQRDVSARPPGARRRCEDVRGVVLRAGDAHAELPARAHTRVCEDAAREHAAHDRAPDVGGWARETQARERGGGEPEERGFDACEERVERRGVGVGTRAGDLADGHGAAPAVGDLDSVQRAHRDFQERVGVPKPDHAIEITWASWCGLRSRMRLTQSATRSTKLDKSSVGTAVPTIRMLFSAYIRPEASMV
ncbi:hypothetical protein PsYK624_132370 [Phanerochaete sordida]|uniref:Uncharacterized protein n=1 Tax=Phanerochaete sordida TaxID=48140 RepID=A0A9P3GK73_9APHY|nr:hypothetical protein PsYK624_132370 [Phanerochaete sordida]